MPLLLALSVLALFTSRLTGEEVPLLLVRKLCFFDLAGVALDAAAPVAGVALLVRYLFIASNILYLY